MNCRDLGRRPKWILRWCACYINHRYEMQIENRSESDHRSCESTLAVAKKVQKKIWGFNKWTREVMPLTRLCFNRTFEFVSTLEGVRSCTPMGLSSVRQPTCPAIRWKNYGRTSLSCLLLLRSRMLKTNKVSVHLSRRTSHALWGSQLVQSKVGPNNCL